ncbi:MAG: extracellular solute-binding protein, partial [Caldilineaceae bacterium]|nr:extracellular solute-binding protein [Caldilineaceae bacterium]
MKQFSINPLLFIHTLVALLLLAACGPEETDIPAELPPAEITIVTGNNPTQVETELFRSFEDTYPGVKVKTENFGRNPRAYLESDTPPDVMIMWTGDWFLDPVRDGLAADLTDLWAQANLAESYPAGLRRLTELNGKQYFMPVGYQWRGIYYNREVFAENGLQPPQTWEEFLDACETLILNGVYPIALPRNAPWNTSLWFDYLDMRLNGAAFHRALIAGEESFTDERVRNVFLTWQMLFEKSYFLMDTS